MQYKQELFAQKTPYLQWLKEQGQQLDRPQASGKQIHRLPFFSCMDSVPGPDGIDPDAVCLFVRSGGTLADDAENVVRETFLANREAVLAYADEDYRGSLRELYGIADGAFDEEITAPYRFGDAECYRGAPWFKPDFSPDTLASFFYVGSVFAVRGDVLWETVRTYGGGISLYELVYRIFMRTLHLRQGSPDVPAYRERIVHIPNVLYTNAELGDADRLEGSGRMRQLSGAAQDAGKERVSIIIPSKDNAEVLRQCLGTLIKNTRYDNYEILLVDNGSCGGQRAAVSRIIEELRGNNSCINITCLYREMAFNFSKMCNIGAQSAQGAYLLFLNDDIEVMDGEEGAKWLDYMMEHARKRHVGAVGAKLYYPLRPDDNGCYRIQHAGIANMGIGPAHKLGGMADKGCLYHGHNTRNYDMLAVTAACMLVRRSVFDELGGFDEDLAVAYNDVEFCFRLYQSGRFNVQVNDAALIHHESLSRGQDTSPGKRKRLQDEKQTLYKKHPLLKGSDPFYSPNLVQWKKDTEYNTGYLYGYDSVAEPAVVADEKKRPIFQRYDFRNMLHAKCRPAAKLYDRLTGYGDMMLCIDSIEYDDGMTGGVTIEGWHAVRNTDNAGLSRKLWLICRVRNADFRNVYAFDIAPKIREDVAGLLEGKGTKNTALSGLHVNIGKGVLKPGTYGIGVVCGNKLVCDPEKYVVIPDPAGPRQKGVVEHGKG